MKKHCAIALILSAVSMSAAYAQSPAVAPAPDDNLVCPINLKGEADKYVKLHSLKRPREIYSKIDAAFTDNDRKYLYDKARESLAELAIQEKIDAMTKPSPKDIEAYRASHERYDAVEKAAGLRIRQVVEKLGILKSGSDYYNYVDPTTGRPIRLLMDPDVIETLKNGKQVVSGFNSKLPLLQMLVTYDSKKDGDLEQVMIPSWFDQPKQSTRLFFRDPIDLYNDPTNSITNLAEALYFQAGEQYPACREIVEDHDVSQREIKIADSAINNTAGGKPDSAVGETTHKEQAKHGGVIQQ